MAIVKFLRTIKLELYLFRFCLHCVRSELTANTTDNKTQSKLSTDRILQYEVLLTFMTHSSDAVPSNSAEEELENRTKLDFFLPVIDTAPSYIDRRFNAE